MNLNFKLLAILIIILGFLVLGKYSLYAHNKIKELNNDVNEYQKALLNQIKQEFIMKLYQKVRRSIILLFLITLTSLSLVGCTSVQQVDKKQIPENLLVTDKTNYLEDFSNLWILSEDAKEKLTNATNSGN